VSIDVDKKPPFGAVFFRHVFLRCLHATSSCAAQPPRHPEPSGEGSSVWVTGRDLFGRTVSLKILRFAQNDKIYVILSLQAKDPAVWLTRMKCSDGIVERKILRFAQNDM